MATVVVPTNYSTLALAVAAVSDGDTIILEDGTHNVPSTITTARNRIKVIARNPLGARVTCNTAVFSGSLDRWEIHGVDFQFGSATSTRLTSSNAQCSLFRCRFDFSARVASSSTNTLAMTLDNNRHLTVRGCHFKFNPAVTHGRHIYVLISVSTPTGAVTVESCVFEGYRAGANQPIRFFGAFGQCTVRIRNNTFLNCVSGGSSYASIATNASFGAGSTLEIANNAIEGQSGPSHTNISLSNPGSDVWQVASNIRYHTGAVGSFATSAAWVNETGAVTASAPTLDASLMPLPSGPALRSGDPSTAAVVDYLSRPFGIDAAPSRGAVEYYPATPRFHAKRARIPFGGGLSMAIHNSGTHAVTFPSYTYESFDSPTEAARALTLLVAINAPTGGEEHGFEAVYWGGAYRWHSSLPLDFTVSGASASLFGAGTWSSETAGTLGHDPSTVESPYALDEKALGEESRAMGDVTGVGRVYSALRPAGGERHVFRFGAVTYPEDPRQTARTAAERFMGAFNAGAEARVWRSVLNDEPWHETDNPMGYSDIVVASTGDMGSLSWYDKFRRRFDLTVEGVEVRDV